MNSRDLPVSFEEQRMPVSILMRSRGLFRARLAAVLLLCVGAWGMALAPRQDLAARPSEAEEFYFHHDHVIGTSLDLWVVARDEELAVACETAILDEIERLRRVFSTFDSDSELSRLNRSLGPVAASPEMLQVLRAYEVVQQRSYGAFNGQLGELVAVWKAAEKAGRLPEDLTLRRIVEDIQRPGWIIDDERHTVTRLSSQPLNLNSIAKGFMIQAAGAAARARVPALRGLLLNLGGDMTAWGPKWTIGIQDPHHPEENAAPLTLFRLQDQAIATSGGYERYYTIAGQRYAHIFDPRSGWPAQGVASATVVARDNVTANALATTLCVLTPEEGLRLVADTRGAECLLVAADGRQFRSPGLKALELAMVRSAVTESVRPDDAWPEGYQVSVTLTLPTITDAKKYRRPYVAVWVENGDGKAVRTITVWGSNPRYTKDLNTWWKFAKDDADLVKAVTRATRGPGKYSLVWDGKDDAGKVLPQGTYTLKVEVHREHGKHLHQTGKIECGPQPATVTLDKNAETDATVVEYGKKK
jgi:FAD:protein FMN transferase